MTEDLLHTAEDGGTVHLCTYQGEPALRLSQDSDFTVVNVPQRVADAIRTALAVDDTYTIVAHKSSTRFADVASLLEQCDREDAAHDDTLSFLYTREIRRLLSIPVLCRNAPRELGGARCSLAEHGGDGDSWHVDTERCLRWRTVDNVLDVRGWNPVEDGPVSGDEQGRRVAALQADAAWAAAHVSPEVMDARLSAKKADNATTFVMRIPPQFLAEALDICKIPSDYGAAQVREKFRAHGMHADDVTDAQIMEAQNTRGGDR